VALLHELGVVVVVGGLVHVVEEVLVQRVLIVVLTLKVQAGLEVGEPDAEGRLELGDPLGVRRHVRLKLKKRRQLILEDPAHELLHGPEGCRAVAALQVAGDGRGKDAGLIDHLHEHVALEVVRHRELLQQGEADIHGGHFERLVRVGFWFQRLEGDFGLGGPAASIFIGF